MNVKELKHGDICTVNLNGDMWCEFESRQFINRSCIFQQINKSGLVMIALKSNPKLVYSVPQSNISEWKEDET